MSHSRLEHLAYRMLGSVADAEDVVQEARLKLLGLEAAPDNEDAWLFRVVTNLSLDKLREQKRRRERYPGPWLPDPLPTEQAGGGDEPEALAELAENLSLGLVLMLERLSPAERAVFVLREGFDLGFDDIGQLVGASAASCRQRYRRARGHLGGEERFEVAHQVDGGAQRQVLERLLTAVADGDFEGLVALFADDCVAYADGGGIVSAAIAPVTDPERIARVTLHTARKAAEEGELEFRWTSLNGGVGLLINQDGALHSTLQADVEDGRIRALYIMRNPEKLAHLAV